MEFPERKEYLYQTGFLCAVSVSYTHLDVYKRQALISGFMAKESVVSTLEVLFSGNIASVLDRKSVV